MQSILRKMKAYILIVALFTINHVVSSIAHTEEDNKKVTAELHDKVTHGPGEDPDSIVHEQENELADEKLLEMMMQSIESDSGEQQEEEGEEEQQKGEKQEDDSAEEQLTRNGVQKRDMSADLDSPNTEQDQEVQSEGMLTQW